MLLPCWSPSPWSVTRVEPLLPTELLRSQGVPFQQPWSCIRCSQGWKPLEPEFCLLLVAAGPLPPSPSYRSPWSPHRSLDVLLLLDLVEGRSDHNDKFVADDTKELRHRCIAEGTDCWRRRRPLCSLRALPQRSTIGAPHQASIIAIC